MQGFEFRSIDRVWDAWYAAGAQAKQDLIRSCFYARAEGSVPQQKLATRFLKKLKKNHPVFQDVLKQIADEVACDLKKKITNKFVVQAIVRV